VIVRFTVDQQRTTLPRTQKLDLERGSSIECRRRNDLDPRRCSVSLGKLPLFRVRHQLDTWYCSWVQRLELKGSAKEGDVASGAAG